MGRILALDYGHVRIGLALSDEDQKFAFEHEIWKRPDFFERLPELIKEKDIAKIILGYPLNMASEPTAKTAEVLRFKKELEEKAKLPVELVDERLSSKMAAKLAGTDKNIDALAAQILLENYLAKK